MPELQRKYWRLTLGGALLAALLSVALTRGLWAEATGIPNLPLFDWMSFSGVVALCAVAVQWGEVRQQLKAIPQMRADHKDSLEELRDEVREGFRRLDASVNTLYEIAGANRRQFNREHYGVRAALGDEEIRHGKQHD